MDWNQSRLGYYADFLVVPFLVILALMVGFSYHQNPVTLAAFAALGFAAWTFAEYWIHRALFHHYFKVEHWLHHKKPLGYVSAPAWLTGAIHGVGFLLAMSLGHAAGTGAFVGFEVGYCTYIVVHDAIHHRKHKGFGWLRRRWEHHHLHHSGYEVNFGVETNVWDKLFGSYRGPSGRRHGCSEAICPAGYAQRDLTLNTV